MNERIRELSEKADLYSRSDNSSMLFENYQKRYTEKFAELLIRECLNEIHVADVSVLKGKGYYIDKVAEHLEKNFGIDNNKI